ncbi:MAG: ATP-dependent DNA helicase [Alphaproteobacteria bacterium]|nr:ATP-dependent DNA helicase [Alphaproteobacteria bacterium]
MPFPAIHASHAGIWIADSAGVAEVPRAKAISAVAQSPHILLNAPMVAARLGYPELSGLDLLELFAFLHPARFMVPTVNGLAEVLGLNAPESEAGAAPFLRAAATKLLEGAGSAEWPEREGAWTAAQSLMRLRWPWAQLLTVRIKMPQEAEKWLFSKLPEWEESPPRPAPKPVALDLDSVDARLTALVGTGAEPRPGQRAYAEAATQAFAPRMAADKPQIVLAEAGTGIGKTLGYLAPSSLWSTAAQGPVWISTYTKALQRQLDGETGKLGLPPGKIAIRKGRENYLCLLNLEDALQGGFAGRSAIFAHLVARWAAFSRDGDMVGGDLPGWLVTLFRRNGATALTDRRGECVYAGCPHYRKCFIERSVRASAGADIVIANHALVMVNAARGREEGTRPTRYVFDEGHHLFDAADSMFSVALSGTEAIELRRWIMGPESNTRGRRRGLAARLADVASYDAEGGAAINAAVVGCQALPSDGWLGRVSQGDPFGPLERLLAAVRGLVYARDTNAEAGYGLETECAELDGALLEAVEPAAQALDALLKPLIALGRRLEAVLTEAPDWMDAQARARVEGALASLSWRTDTLGGWLALLARMGGAPDPDFVDWLSVERYEGREFDVALNRHWLDPMRPFAQAVLKPAHGALVTSATLRGSEDWAQAEARMGAAQAAALTQHFATPSPFDYATQSEVLIVTDIKRGDVPQLAQAYARLIAASEGGALGLFTAIRRLRAVHARIADHLSAAGLPLYAQHVDPIDTGTLVDIFRADRHASLIGTDALRDGVDVPGHSLRLVIMEGVPWVKPSVLHAARRAAYGGNAYDDMLVRARLAQGFGRLIRRADDHGSFVILSAACPSRLLTAFPPGTPIIRLTLDAAVARTKNAHKGLSTPPPVGQEAPLC